MPQYDPQFPLIRKAWACPRCCKPKKDGLVICWPCNNELKSRHHGTWGNAFDAFLISVECFLTACVDNSQVHVI